MRMFCLMIIVPYCSMGIASAQLVDDASPATNETPQLHQGTSADSDQPSEQVALAYKERAYEYLDKGDVNKAMLFFNKSIRIDPYCGAAYNGRGLLWVRLKNPKRAIEDFDKAVELCPKRMEPYANRGNVYLTNKEYDKAFDDLDRAVIYAPGNARCYVDRGIVFESLEKLDDAISDYDKAIELKADWSIGYFRRGVAMGKKHKLQRAMEALNRSISLDPKCADAYRHRAIIRASWEDRETAIEDCNIAISLDSMNGPSYALRGFLLKSKNDRERAVADFDEVLRLNPTNTHVHRIKGKSLEEMGKWNDALRCFEQCLKLDSGDYLACAHIAWIRSAAPDAALRGGAAAVELAEKACTLSEWHDGFCVSILAAAHAENGDFDKAISFEEKGAAIIRAQLDERLRLGMKDLSARALDADRSEEAEVAIVQLKKDCEQSKWTKLLLIKLLAEAYANAGDHESAVSYMTRFHRSFAEGVEHDLDHENRIALYRQGVPFRENVGGHETRLMGSLLSKASLLEE